MKLMILTWWYGGRVFDGGSVADGYLLVVEAILVQWIYFVPELLCIPDFKTSLPDY